MLGRTLIYIIILIAIMSLFVLSSHVSYRLDLFDSDERALVYELAPSTDAWGLFDPESGIVFLGSNTDAPHSIASITKLFTAHAALTSDKLGSPVTISWSDLEADGRAGKLAYGDTYTIHELLFPLLIESSNDAAAAIERALGSEFPFATEFLISKLDLANTTITGSSGIRADNISTVEDLARFYSYIRREQPHITDITVLPLYIGKQTGWVNMSPGVKHAGYRGGKHGFTPEAGNTFIGTFIVDEREIGIVLLGSGDLTADLGEVLAYLESNH